MWGLTLFLALVIFCSYFVDIVLQLAHSSLYYQPEAPPDEKLDLLRLDRPAVFKDPPARAVAR